MEDCLARQAHSASHIRGSTKGRRPWPELQHSNTCPASIDPSCLERICIQSQQWSLDDDEWKSAEGAHRRCRCSCVFLEESRFRRVWNVIVFILVLYIATIYLFRLAFVEFYVGEYEMGLPAIPKTCTILDLSCPDKWWFILDEAVELVFIADLALQFFFSFRDSQDVEVINSRVIARNYFSGLFFINFLACVPFEIFETLTGGWSVDSGALRTVKIWRLLRATRLIRLFKLGWLAQLVRDHSWNLRWRQLLRSRGFRILGFLACLLMMVHILACGWYICAAFHDDISQTWVGRRTMDLESRIPLTQQPPSAQWLHSMYFILTIFTTVGFGDISAYTMSEMTYVCVTMLLGIMINGIIISSVQAILSAVDKSDALMSEKMGLVEAFATHTELDEESTRRMGDWVKRSVRNWERNTYNREEVQLLITSRGMPGALLDHLSQNLFSERLCRSRFLSVCRSLGPVPQRLPLLLAVMVNRVDFLANEVVYQMEDFPFTAFLVLGGTFAHVGAPTPAGGTDRICTQAPREQEQNYAFVPTLALPLQTGKLKHTRSCLPQVRQDLGFGVVAPCDRLYPYQMFSTGSYFGEVELLMSRPRYATMRCESAHGSVLVLRKESFLELAAEFPKFGAAWRRGSVIHERQRQWCLAKLTMGHSHRYLAAMRIQQFVKKRRGLAAKSWGSELPTTLPRLLSVSNAGASMGRKIYKGEGNDCSSKPEESLHQAAAMLRFERRSTATGGALGAPALEYSSRKDQQPTTQDYAHLCSSIDALRADFAKLQNAICPLGVQAM